MKTEIPASFDGMEMLSWKDKDGDGWTNLEEYLNVTHPSTASDPMKDQGICGRIPGARRSLQAVKSRLPGMIPCRCAIGIICICCIVWCRRCGVKVEWMKWSAGKSPYAVPLMHVLARWARRLSWKEVAGIFQVSWDAVYRSVQWLVGYGLEHRKLDGVSAIGTYAELFSGQKAVHQCGNGGQEPQSSSDADQILRAPQL